MTRQRIGALRQTDPFQHFPRPPIGIGAAQPCTHRKGPAMFSFAERMTEQVELLKYHTDTDLGAFIGERARR